MIQFETKYCKFINRFGASVGGFWSLFLLFSIEIIAMTQNDDIFLITTSFFVPTLLVIIVSKLLRSRKYLSRIEIKEDTIYFTIFNFNKENNCIEMPLKDFRIQLEEDFYNLLIDIRGRTSSDVIEASKKYVLVLKRKNSSKKDGLEIIHKQFMLGGWTKEKQIEVCNFIRTNQGTIMEKV